MLSNQEGSAARNFLYSSVVWLVIPVLLGLITALLMAYPRLAMPWLSSLNLTFGRLRPMHVNLVVFGWLSMSIVGAVFYIVPRLTGTRLHSERLGNLTMWLWNLLMVLVGVTLALGLTQGREYAELIWPLDMYVLAALVLVAYNVFMTVARRKERQLYVSLWYFLGSLIWFPLVYLIGNVVWVTPWNAPEGAAWGGALTGVNDAIVNWFYGHNVVGLWFTTVGVGIAYYLLPQVTKNPLYSHKLSLIGFWTIAFTYVWVGTHHLIWGPVPRWTQYLAIFFSVLVIVPVWTVVWNFYKTIDGKWHLLLESAPLKFLVVAIFSYFLTCLQGPFQALRSVSPYVHFTNWTVGHAHLALLSTFSLISFAAIYYILPRVSGRELYNWRLANWHFWLTTVGFSVFFLSLTAAGLIQGAMWMAGNIPFLRVVQAMHPYMVARVLGGAVIVLAQLIFAYNILMTARSSRVKVQPAVAEGGAEEFVPA